MYCNMSGCVNAMKFHWVLLTILIGSAGHVSAGVIAVAVYEFNGSENYNDPSFDDPAFDSSDTDVQTTAARLGNSNLTGGGASNYLSNATMFNSSYTGPRGLNAGGANATSPTNYVYFTVTPNTGTSVTYSSLSYFNNAYSRGKIQLSVIDGGGSEQVLDDFTITATGSAAVTQRVIDFTDFTSSNVTEWRLYLYNSGGYNFGIRLDDITLNRAAAAVPEPSTAIAMGLLGVVGFAGNRRRRRGVLIA